MSKILVVVDMQNDFIDGALGTSEALKIVPYVKEVIEGFDGKVFFTRDTHFENYMESQEGKNLPVPHCIKGTYGWEIRKELDMLRTTEPIDKLTFGSSDLVEVLKAQGEIESITFSQNCAQYCYNVGSLLWCNFHSLCNSRRLDQGCYLHLFCCNV